MVRPHAHHDRLGRGTSCEGDGGHSSVLLPDTESQAALGTFGAGFSRQHTQQEDHVIPRVAAIQSADDDETQMLDALERDLAGPVVFPLSDGAEVDVAHVGRPRQSRRLVLIPVQDRSHSESASVEDQVVSDDTKSLHGEGVCCQRGGRASPTHGARSCCCRGRCKPCNPGGVNLDG